MVAPGTIKPHKQFKAQVYILTKAEGGRHTPFVSNYQPTLYTRTADTSAALQLPEGRSTGRCYGRMLANPVPSPPSSVSSLPSLSFPSFPHLFHPPPPSPLLSTSPPPLPFSLPYPPPHFPLSSPSTPVGIKMVMPGDDTPLTVMLGTDLPLEINQRFTLREGRKTVGTGVITEIID